MGVLNGGRMALVQWTSVVNGRPAEGGVRMCRKSSGVYGMGSVMQVGNRAWRARQRRSVVVWREFVVVGWRSGVGARVGRGEGCCGCG